MQTIPALLRGGFTTFFALQCLASAHGQVDSLRFRDVGPQVGLLPAAAGIMGHGAGWGDVDGDGWPDLYIATFHYTDSQPNLLFRNRKGNFELDTQSSIRVSTRGTGVLLVDLDNDGDLDLYVASMPGPADSRLANRFGHPFAGCSMFRNDGDGNFTNVSTDNAACPAAFGGRSATVLDIDGDGLLDLLVGEEPVAGYNGSQTRTSRLFRNLGGLQFADVSQSIGIPQDAAGLGVAAADMNQDGWPDFFLASTLGNYLMLNDGTGKFHRAEGSQETFRWPTAKGDDMVCGVTIGDVNGDELPDIVIGQHYSAPWKQPVANRLYLHRGTSEGIPKYEDVTEAAGLVPLPLKAPHVEIQDFDNDGRPDILTSMIKFDGETPHPVIFRQVGQRKGIPIFEAPALQVNDFPDEIDRSIRRSGDFFERMVAKRRVTYSAPAPTCDFDRDGRLDIAIPSWWPELPTLLLKNETPGGNWLDVQVVGREKVNRMGIGARVNVYRAGHAGDPAARIGSREIATGFGYASSQQAIAHFGLGEQTTCDIVVTFPHGNGTWTRNGVAANQRIQAEFPPQ